MMRRPRRAWRGRRWSRRFTKTDDCVTCFGRRSRKIGADSPARSRIRAPVIRRIATITSRGAVVHTQEWPGLEQADSAAGSMRHNAYPVRHHDSSSREGDGQHRLLRPEMCRSRGAFGDEGATGGTICSMPHLAAASIASIRRVWPAARNILMRAVAVRCAARAGVTGYCEAGSSKASAGASSTSTQSAQSWCGTDNVRPSGQPRAHDE